MTQPYDAPLFALDDVPPQPPAPTDYARMAAAPMVAPDAWTRAAKRAEGQCEEIKPETKTARADRCSRTLRGGWRLYLGADGRLRCETHDKAAEKARQLAAGIAPKPRRRPRR